MTWILWLDVCEPCSTNPIERVSCDVRTGKKTKRTDILGGLAIYVVCVHFPDLFFKGFSRPLLLWTLLQTHQRNFPLHVDNKNCIISLALQISNHHLIKINIYWVYWINVCWHYLGYWVRLWLYYVNMACSIGTKVGRDIKFCKGK